MASSSHCTTFRTFQHSLIGKQAFSVTVRAGSSSYTCNDAVVASQLIEKFAVCNYTCSSLSMSCGGENWYVGSCGYGGEITVGGSGVCYCSYSGLSIRPCINNQNWGGGGTTCGAVGQELSIHVIGVGM